MQHPTRARPAGSSDPPYDLDVVDEAIVNPVAHRDYAISGSKIRLFLFADRLELYSPGGLPNTITLDEMPYRTFTRNQLLVSFLSRVRSKRTDQGVPRIARRRRAEDPPGRRGAFRPAARVRAVRRRAPADLVRKARAPGRLRTDHPSPPSANVYSPATSPRQVRRLQPARSTAPKIYRSSADLRTSARTTTRRPSPSCSAERVPRTRLIYTRANASVQAGRYPAEACRS